MIPPYGWPDPDRDYANGAFIAEADSYPPPGPPWQRPSASTRATGRC